MNAKVLEGLKRSAAVPSVPQVVTRFLELMQDPNFKYDDLVRVLSADAGTVSEILRLVNSALFGVRQKIVSLRQALTLLGPKRTRSLILGRFLVDRMAQKHLTRLDMSYFWRRSLASSVVASRIADRILPKFREEVFISALLADIGLPILAESFPEAYEPISREFCPRGKTFTADQEIELIEVAHSQVSAMILKYWALPDMIAVAVNLHQSANPGEGDTATIARILNASDSIAKLLCEIPDTDSVVRTCMESARFAHIDMDVLVELLPSIEADIEELAGVLRIDVIPSNVYAIIAKTIHEKISSAAMA
ncbi:MAG: HDOD domain-containing protein [Phycisphaerae bacterium]|nr:HDOD domain-containing protein [Phycisphaerae bacterium]